METGALNLMTQRPVLFVDLTTSLLTPIHIRVLRRQLASCERSDLVSVSVCQCQFASVNMPVCQWGVRMLSCVETYYL